MVLVRTDMRQHSVIHPAEDGAWRKAPGCGRHSAHGGRKHPSFWESHPSSWNTRNTKGTKVSRLRWCLHPVSHLSDQFAQRKSGQLTEEQAHQLFTRRKTKGLYMDLTLGPVCCSSLWWSGRHGCFAISHPSPPLLLGSTASPST